jgi:hypothetical protein
VSRKEMTAVYLTVEQREALTAISRATRVPFAVLVRDALDFFLHAREAVRASMCSDDAPSASLARAAGAPDASPSSADALPGQAAPRRRVSARASAVRTAELLDELEGVIEVSTRLLRDEEVDDGR